MRPGATFPQEILAKPPAAASPRSAWHSPVPYLFGGLAAMLGLIALALLILACSYWKLSGYLDSASDGQSQEAGDDARKPGDDDAKSVAFYDQRIVVIMAGEKNPSFLATPMSSRASSFGEKNDSGASDCGLKGDGHTGD